MSHFADSPIPQVCKAIKAHGFIVLDAKMDSAYAGAADFIYRFTPIGKQGGHCTRIYALPGTDRVLTGY